MKRPIPTVFRRGYSDYATEKKRCRQRVKELCPVCAVLGVKKLARRGWANGLCISCARCNGCMEPRKARNRRHHKKEMPSEKEPREKKPKVKKEPKEKKPNHYVKDSVASRHQDRDNMSEGLNANWKDYYPDLIEEDGNGWQPSVNRRLNLRAPQKKSMVVMPREKNSKPNAQAHHVRAENEGVIEKAEDAGGKRWSKEVVFVPKLPPITQPTMEREKQRRMGCRDVKALRHRMGNYPDSSYVTPLRRPTGGMRTPGGPQELA